MIAGVDEAGRGPVLGPLVLCGVLFDEQTLEELRSAGVRDSKLLSSRRREALVKFIMRKAKGLEVVELSPAEIDEFRLVKKVNLNEVEALNIAKIIDRLQPEVA
ncbi:MAG: ribonuclease HII, partial [Hadesarchaea archaeon]|nr:ribonuclease HII [Hadesarchaea archaeon]